MRLRINGSPLYLHGANYPWMVRGGKSNYGLDFGTNSWGTHQGVSTNLEQVERDFTEMEHLGFNTLRWFVFTDGRGGILFDDDDMPLRVSDTFFDDMDAALLVARSHGVRIIFVLLDFLWLYDSPQPDNPKQKHYSHILKSEDGRRRLVENVFTPVFARYANDRNVLAWEVMNEPDWIIEELDLNRKQVKKGIAITEFKSFVRQVADASHLNGGSLVTVGGGRIKYIDVWDDDELALDFLQVHTYNDFLNHKWDGRIFGKKFGDLNLKRPLLIGEFTTNGRQAFDDTPRYIDIPLDEYLTTFLRNDYAGTLYWSFNAVDKCGTENRETLLHWKQKLLA